MSLGLFVFGMDTAPYNDFEQTIGWRHADQERFRARPAHQFAGPGEDAATISGHLVPEIGGKYSALDTLKDMADTGGNWPLMNGLGVVLGQFRIEKMRKVHHHIMAGGIPRAMDFILDLTRVA
jgi:phage protein U